MMDASVRRPEGTGRTAIIAAALSLIGRNGYNNTSMESIALMAGVSIHTLHRLFRNKEQILIAFFADTLSASAEQVSAIGGFEEYSLQEKLQSLLETQLEQLLPYREILSGIIAALGVSVVQNLKEMNTLRHQFLAITGEYVQDAVDKDEIPPVDRDDAVVRAMADFYSTVVVYWLLDQSDGFSSTTTFIDKSLELLIAAMAVRVRLLDLTNFLLGRHLRSLLTIPWQVHGASTHNLLKTIWAPRRNSASVSHSA